MTVRLICSAYTDAQDAHANAQRTSDLLRWAAQNALHTEVCIGVYKGKREAAVQITGIPEDQVAPTARWLGRTFKQQCVYVGHKGKASLVHADGTTEDLGDEVLSTGGLESLRGLFGGSDPDSYTEYLDGRVLTTFAVQSKSALKAA